MACPLAGTRRSRDRRFQVLLIESEDTLPTIRCLLGAVTGAVDREEAVAGAIVAMELVGLSGLLQPLLRPVHLALVGVGVFVAEDAEDWAGDAIGEVDGRRGPGRRELGGVVDDDAATPTVHGRVDTAQATGGEVDLA